MYWPFSGEEKDISCRGCNNCNGKVVIRPRLKCCLGREVLLLRRCGYNRVIASTVENEREREGKLELIESSRGGYLMSVVLGTT